MPEKKILYDALDLLREKQELRPTDMLKAMKERGFNQAETAEAVSYLIRHHQVQLTPERFLRPTSAPAHSHA